MVRNSDQTVTHKVTIPPVFKKTKKKPVLIVLTGPLTGKMFTIAMGELIIGRDADCDIQVTGRGISRKHATLIVKKDEILLRDEKSTNGTYINGTKITSITTLEDGDRFQIGANVLLKLTFQDDLEETFQKEMYESATRDPLTGIYNKKYFYERLKEEVGYSKRHQYFLAVIIFDIDHFKLVNDTYGHQAGDMVLCALSETVKSMIRNEDIFCRYGGEEFTIITRGISPNDVFRFCERMRKHIEKQKISFKDEYIHITASFGYAVIPNEPIKDFEQLIEIADKALYESKEHGRNQCYPKLQHK